MGSLKPTVVPGGSRVLALDVDGVLLHAPVRGQRWDSSLQADLGIDPERLQREFFGRYWSEIVVGKGDLRKSLASYLREIGSDVPVGDLLRYWFQAAGVIDEKVLDIVRAWRGKSPLHLVVAVSNQEVNRVEHLQGVPELLEVFDAGFWSCEVGLVKRDSRFFTRCKEHYLYQAQWVSFYDDELKNVSAAEEAGWDAHLFVSAELLNTDLDDSPTE